MEYQKVVDINDLLLSAVVDTRLISARIIDYDVIIITREKPGSGIRDAIVVVLCKEHYTRVERLDGKSMETIAEAATRQSRQQE